MNEWYREWFSSDQYLKVYKNRDERDAIKSIELIFKNIDSANINSALDMACGNGRHSYLLAQKGINVIGFDLSPRMIQVAKRRNIDFKSRTNFLISDIRMLPFKKNFDLIINLFTSFGYFQKDEENFRVFYNVKESLRKGGYFVFDFFNKDHLLNNLVEESVNQFNGDTVIQRRYVENDRIQKQITIKSSAGSNNFFESVKLYSSEELISELVKSGLRIVKKFGDYDGEKFDALKSPRLFLIAQK